MNSRPTKFPGEGAMKTSSGAPAHPNFGECWPEPNPGPADRLARGEEADLVRRAVERLPEDQRLAVVLRHWQGLTYEEIGSVLRVPLGSSGCRWGR